MTPLITENYSNVFGYHVVTKDDNNYNKTFKICSNIANTLGLIPVIGSIIGLVRIIFCAYELQDCKNYLLQNKLDSAEKDEVHNEMKTLWVEIARGVWELTSLGFVFAIPDIAVTIARAANKPTPAIESEKSYCIKFQ